MMKGTKARLYKKDCELIEFCCLNQYTGYTFHILSNNLMNTLTTGIDASMYQHKVPPLGNK